MFICLADNQDITRVGIKYLAQKIDSQTEFHRTEDKAELILRLQEHGDAIVVLDYTLFDLNDVEDLQILHDRFPRAMWILFSVDLSTSFIKRALAIGQTVSVLLKDSSVHEISDCILYATRHQRYICQKVTELILAPQPSTTAEDAKLTPTELEILKDIALGMTTKEIADKRFSSFHTVNTHRKNIFRKIGVNNAHEATKYALRAGLVDSAEYYI